jgi:hypothetical protein
MPRRSSLGLVTLTALAIVLGPAPVPAARSQEFRPVIVGDDIQQFELVNIGATTMTIHDGEVRITGKPNGYFATKTAYHNYVVRFEWKYERPEGLESDAKFRGNSGLLVHVQAPKVWPESIEVQLMNADAGNIFGVKPGTIRGKKDPAAQKRAIKPVGEWNTEEVTCKDGTIVCTINGIEVARATDSHPDRGKVAWQSEGALVRFRKLEIKPLD